MEIITWHGKRKLPTSVTEYFVALYCKRRKLKPHISQSGALAVWKILSSAEKALFRDKFEKWQEDNDKKMLRVLEHAEPFLKKKASINQKNIESLLSGSSTGYDENQTILNLSEQTVDNISNADLELTKQNQKNIESLLSGSSTGYDENQTILNLSEQTVDNISNADLELTKQENIDAESLTTDTRYDNEYHNNEGGSMINIQENIDDNMSNLVSEASNQYYAASVIDRDIDEATVEQETKNKITEPIPPTNLKARELFETIKCSGARPELATVEWKDLTNREKTLYRNATIRIKKDYLNKYEKYLHSLSDPELFKIYINISEEF